MLTRQSCARQIRNSISGPRRKSVPDNVVAWPGSVHPRIFKKKTDLFDVSPSVLRSGLFSDEADVRLASTYLLAGVPSDVPLIIAWTAKAGRTVGTRTTVVMRAVNRRGEDDIKIARTFTRGQARTWSVEHTYFAMADRHRGGAARRMMRASVEIYDRLGIGRITVHANIDVGGYVWAKLGFAATDPAHIRAELAEALEDDPGSVIFTEANRVADESDDDDLMYNLARLEIEGLYSCGKSLLRGAHWYGHATLKDPRHRARLARHFATEHDDTHSNTAGGGEVEHA